MVPASAGRFCWVDLAASDASRAADLYTALFGWSARAQAANGGTLVRLSHRGRDMASLYQMQRAALEAGASSHWTPYVRVDDAGEAARRSHALGATIAVEAFVVEGIARIALIVDPVGATIGLWEELR